MSDGWLLVLGVLAAFSGFVSFDHAARNQRFRPLSLFWAAVWTWLAAENLGELWAQGLRERGAAVGLIWGAASPIVSGLVWGRSGRNWRLVKRLCLCLVVTLSVLIFWPVKWTPVDPLLWSFVCGSLTLLPYRLFGKFWRRRQQLHQRKQHELEQRQLEQQEAEAKARQEEQDEDVLRNLVEQLLR